MKKFLILRQKNQNFDFESNFDFVEAEDKTQAFQNYIKKSYFWDYYQEMEDRDIDSFIGSEGCFTDIDFISVLEVVDEDRDLWEGWKNQVLTDLANLEIEHQRKEDLAEYDRLRKKLNK